MKTLFSLNKNHWDARYENRQSLFSICIPTIFISGITEGYITYKIL
jgi:uncharacterized membrane protein SpoIIM required for sporulation